MIRLDDTGITEAVDRVYPSGTGTYQVNPADRAIAKAQLKRVVEKVGKVLVKYSVIDGKLLRYVDGTVPLWALPNIDWQALSEEAKG